MSDRSVDVRITAIDNASRVLANLGKAADQAARDLKDLGKAGKDSGKAMADAERSMTRAGTSIEKAGASSRRAAVDMEGVGVALMAMGGALTFAGNAAMDQERQIIALQTAYAQFGEVGINTMLQFAETIQQTTQFSDDAARRSALTFASLGREYGLTLQEIQQLMTVSADLASLYGLGLEDASKRIQSAIRGETEAAEMLGLALNQQSIDRQGLTLTMTNQEAAQFRMNALMEQAAYATGSAATMLQTSSGQWKAFKNDLQDAAQAAGAFIGPMGSMVAGVGLGVAGIAQFSGALKALTLGLRAATVASMAFASTPVGLAILAVGATVGIATKLFMDHRSQVEETAAAWEEAEAAVASLQEQIESFKLVNFSDALWAESAVNSVKKEMDWMRTGLRDEYIAMLGTGGWLDQMISDAMDAEGWDSLARENATQVAEFSSEIIDSLIPDAADQQRVIDSYTRIFSLGDKVSEIQFNNLQNSVDELFRAFSHNEISIDQFIAGLERVGVQAEMAATMFDGLTDAQARNLIAQKELQAQQELALTLTDSSIMQTEQYTQAQQNAADAAVEASTRIRDAAKERHEAQQAEYQTDAYLQDQINDALEDRAEQLRRVGEEGRTAFGIMSISLTDMTGKLGLVNDGLGLTEDRLKGAADAANLFAENMRSLAQANLDQMAEMVTSLMGLDDPLTAWNAAGLGGGLTTVAEGAREAATALDDIFRIFVSNTNATAQQVQSVADWATELIGVEGEYAKIDDLLANQRISQTEYNQAQTAYNDIVRENAEIQEHVLTIQAMQAPLIRDGVVALENQYQMIADMSVEQQAVTLGWMDAATAAKAMEIQTMAAAVAAGQLGDSGEAAFQSYIDGIVATDPVMKQMLLDMGLIEEHMNQDGTITYTVNLDGASEAQSEIEQLTQTIGDLIDVLDDGALNGSYQVTVTGDASQALDSMNQVKAAVASTDGQKATVYSDGNNTNAIASLNQVSSETALLDGTTATVTANAIDNASGPLNNVLALLAAADGRNATSTISINTVYSTIGSPPPRGVPGFTTALGGVPGYAQGGVVTELAEWGTEILRFAGGGTAMVKDRGIYTIPEHTYVSPNNTVGGGDGPINVTIVVQGDIMTQRNLINTATSEITRAIATDLRRTRQASGVRRS